MIGDIFYNKYSSSFSCHQTIFHLNKALYKVSGAHVVYLGVVCVRLRCKCMHKAVRVFFVFKCFLEFFWFVSYKVS